MGTEARLVMREGLRRKLNVEVLFREKDARDANGLHAERRELDAGFMNGDRTTDWFYSAYGCMNRVGGDAQLHTLPSSFPFVPPGSAVTSISLQCRPCTLTRFCSEFASRRGFFTGCYSRS